MSLRRNLVGFTIISLLVCGTTVSIQATYYLDTLFPIGLTGLGQTSDTYWGRVNPYGNTDALWRWNATAQYPNSEDSLIYSLGVNCIGCEDAKK